MAPLPAEGLGVLGVSEKVISLPFIPMLRDEGEPKLLLLNESREPPMDFCHMLLADAEKGDSLPSGPSDGLPLRDKGERGLLLARLAGEPLRGVDDRG